MVKAIFFTTLIGLLAACSVVVSPGHSNDPTAAHADTAAIRGGNDADGTEFFNKYIVRVTQPNGFCTGIVLNEEFVLTAAHCLQRMTNMGAAYWNPANPSVMKVTFSNGESRPVRSWILHQDYVDSHLTSKKKEYHGDILLVQLKGEIPSGYKGSPVILNLDEITHGTKVLLLGHGGSRQGSVDEFDTTTGPLRYNYGNIASTSKKLIWIETDDVSGTCKGDSGGPAMINIDGRWRLAGIAFRGETNYRNERCSKRTAYVPLPPYLNWIKEKMQLMVDHDPLGSLGKRIEDEE